MQGTQALYRSLSFILFPGGSDCKERACNAGDLSSIPGVTKKKVKKVRHVYYSFL